MNKSPSVVSDQEELGVIEQKKLPLIRKRSMERDVKEKEVMSRKNSDYSKTKGPKMKIIQTPKTNRNRIDEMNWLLEPIRKKPPTKSGHISPLRTTRTDTRNKKISIDLDSRSSRFHDLDSNPIQPTEEETEILKNLISRIQTHKTISEVTAVQIDEISKIRNMIISIKLKCVDLRHQSSLVSLGIDKNGFRSHGIISEINLLKKSLREKNVKLSWLKKLIDNLQKNRDNEESVSSTLSNIQSSAHRQIKDLKEEELEELITREKETFDYQLNNEIERKNYLTSRLERIMKLLDNPSFIQNKESSIENTSEDKAKLFDRMKKQNGTISTRKIDLLGNQKRDRKDDHHSEIEPSEGSLF